jgi:hypothetical protein
LFKNSTELKKSEGIKSIFCTDFLINNIDFFSEQCQFFRNQTRLIPLNFGEKNRRIFKPWLGLSQFLFACLRGTSQKWSHRSLRGLLVVALAMLHGTAAEAVATCAGQAPAGGGVHHGLRRRGQRPDAEHVGVPQGRVPYPAPAAPPDCTCPPPEHGSPAASTSPAT